MERCLGCGQRVGAGVPKAMAPDGSVFRMHAACWPDSPESVARKKRRAGLKRRRKGRAAARALDEFVCWLFGKGWLAPHGVQGDLGKLLLAAGLISLEEFGLRRQEGPGAVAPTDRPGARKKRRTRAVPTPLEPFEVPAGQSPAEQVRRALESRTPAQKFAAWEKSMRRTAIGAPASVREKMERDIAARRAELGVGPKKMVSDGRPSGPVDSPILPW